MIIDEITINRANEIIFLALCTHLQNYFKTYDELKEYFADIMKHTHTEICKGAIFSLMNEIFLDKYRPSKKKELGIALYAKGLSQGEVARRLNISKMTVYRWVHDENYVIFPRAPKYMSEALKIFLEQYEYITTPNYLKLV